MGKSPFTQRIDGEIAGMNYIRALNKLTFEEFRDGSFWFVPPWVGKPLRVLNVEKKSNTPYIKFSTDGGEFREHAVSIRQGQGDVYTSYAKAAVICLKRIKAEEKIIEDRLFYLHSLEAEIHSLKSAAK